jgi:hypothetical protein
LFAANLLQDKGLQGFVTGVLNYSYLAHLDPNCYQHGARLALAIGEVSSPGTEGFAACPPGADSKAQAFQLTQDFLEAHCIQTFAALNASAFLQQGTVGFIVQPKLGLSNVDEFD